MLFDRRKSGVSLIEVMVTVTIFAVIMTLTLAIVTLSGKVDRKASAHSQTYRTSAIVLRHIKQELRGAQTLLSTEDGLQDSIEYQSPVWQGDHIKVDARGLPQFSVSRTLALNAQGDLVRTEEGQERILGHLGSGRISFERDSESLLTIRVRVDDTEGGGSHEERGQSEAKITISLAQKQFWDGLSVLETFE